MTDDDTPMPETRANRGAAKTARIPVKVVPRSVPLDKPRWIRARAPNSPRVSRLKELLRQHGLNTVCEEAACPNIGECFARGTATFMIMGKLCTRRCPFCDVAHGRPDPLDPGEPDQLAITVAAMQLDFVVITSVDRDDLRDGGAGHFASCIRSLRGHSPATGIEILVPDFRGRMQRALDCLDGDAPDIFNHNLETVPRLYKKARPGADYDHSLKLIESFKKQHSEIPTKSGLMVGIGETLEEIHAVMNDLRQHGCDRLTIGQYLQPGKYHLPVERYLTPDEFDELGNQARQLGFNHVASGPMVRSSYHAGRQAAGDVIS